MVGPSRLLVGHRVPRRVQVAQCRLLVVLAPLLGTVVLSPSPRGPAGLAQARLVAILVLSRLLLVRPERKRRGQPAHPVPSLFNPQPVARLLVRPVTPEQVER